MTQPPCRLTMTRWPAFILMGAGLASVAGMLFHPAARGPDAEARLQGLVALSPLAMHVHLAMIAAVIALWLALARLAGQWPERGGIWIGARLYALGAAAMLGAALISGFLIGGYLGRMQSVSARVEDVLPPLLLAFAANQTLAGFGTVLMSLAIGAWSLDMIRWRDRCALACGVYGLAAGGGCVVAYGSRWLSLDVPGMTAVVVVHGLWYCLLGGCLLRQGNASASRA